MKKENNNYIKPSREEERLRGRLIRKYTLLMLSLFLGGALTILFLYAVLKKYMMDSNFFKLPLLVLIILISVVMLFFLFKLLIYEIAYRDSIDELKDERQEITEIHQGKPLYVFDEKRSVSGDKKVLSQTSMSQEKEDEGEALEARFPTLSYIDLTHPELERVKCDPALTLESICYNFRQFAADSLHLYYSKKDIMSFISSLACSRIILLQGMSGTGKTSLPVAFGKFISKPTTVVPVQPTWKERSDLLGYYNEFTGKFSETPLLCSLYRAGTSDSIQLVVLDEVNIARVEYYFAEFLSLLELPDQNSRILQVASSGMEGDPKRMINGAMLLPENVWFIGTANNDDSTFSISDKVYDRASVLDLDSRAAPFRAEGEYFRENISLQRLNRLNAEALRRYELTERDLRKIDTLDRFLREAFQVSFGNRIMRQIRVFVPTYVACGGDSSEALDVILSKKVLRKLSGCNPVLVKARSGELIDLLENLFGKGKADDCVMAVKRIAENG